MTDQPVFLSVLIYGHSPFNHAGVSHADLFPAAPRASRQLDRSRQMHCNPLGRSSPHVAWRRQYSIRT